MNLQHLEHLLALVATGSFSRAAEKLHLTQPALSRSIASLEEELGAPLIERFGKRKAVTPLGALVAARAQRISLEVSELKRSAMLLSSLETGSVGLGLGPAPAAMLSVPLLHHMMERYPQIKIRLASGLPALQLQELRARAVDALVLQKRSVLPHDDLSIRLFPGMRLGFLCRKAHPLLDLKKITFAQLRRFPLAASGVGLSDEVVMQLNEYFGKTVHFRDAIQVQSDETSCLIEAVRHSDAVFFGVVEVARTWLTQGELIELPMTPALNLRSQFAFVTLEGATETPPLKVVREFCTERMHDR